MHICGKTYAQANLTFCLESVPNEIFGCCPSFSPVLVVPRLSPLSLLQCQYPVLYKDITMASRLTPNCSFIQTLVGNVVAFDELSVSYGGFCHWYTCIEYLLIVPYYCTLYHKIGCHRILKYFPFYIRDSHSWGWTFNTSLSP